MVLKWAKEVAEKGQMMTEKSQATAKPPTQMGRGGRGTAARLLD